MPGLSFARAKECIKFKVLEKLFPTLSAFNWLAFNKLIENRNSYLYSTGWMLSLEKGKPVDKDGNPIPWMNYAVVKFLDDRLVKSANLFEFGSGYSTFFYAKKVRTVTSVEYDRVWYQSINSKMPDNVHLIYKEKDVDGEYCRTICAMNAQYDVVIVDGRDRVNCVKQSISKLSSHGVILLDDSQREDYEEAIEFSKKLGFRALDLEGLKATGSGIDRTTILYRSANCLGI